MQLKLDLVEVLPEYENQSTVSSLLQKIFGEVKQIEQKTDKVSLDNFYRLQEVEESLDEIIGYMV